jgi:hypothetical protein
MMEDDIFLRVQLAWFDFVKIQFYKVFGPLTRCQPNVDQEERTVHPKKYMLIFLMLEQKGHFWENPS